MDVKIALCLPDREGGEKTITAGHVRFGTRRRAGENAFVSSGITIEIESIVDGFYNTDSHSLTIAEAQKLGHALLMLCKTAGEF